MSVFIQRQTASTVSARDGSAAAADDDEEDEETGTSPFMESSFSEC